MITTVEVEEAKARLGNLLTLALSGNEAILVEAGKPVARLVPFAPVKKKRVAGLNRGQIKMHVDFDKPLPLGYWSSET